MLTFLSVALLIYASMHLYALGKVWMAFPHSPGLAMALLLAGMVLTCSPLIVWYMERQSWYRAAVSAHDFIVLLKHQPLADSDTPFDLQLSGHIHGGQIFPFVYLTRLTYHVRTGLTELADGRKLYVSRGAGTWGPPIRLFAPPEITLITLASNNPRPKNGGE